MAAGQRLPEHQSHRPDVRRLGRQRPGQPLRGDVGECARHIALRSQSFGLLDLRQTEVEHPDGDVPPLCEQHVRRLDVAVNDPARVRVRECLEDLSARLDRGVVIELAAPKRLAEGPARHVLVGDVDMLGVASEPVRALAGGVAQAGGGLRLPLGPGRRLALPRDDLESDVEAVLLVPGKPDRAGPSTPERPQRAVAPEDELALDKGWGCVRHRLSRVGGGTDKSFTCRERLGYGLE